MVENFPQLKKNLIERAALRQSMRGLDFEIIADIGDWNRQHPDLQIVKEDIVEYGKIG